MQVIPVCILGPVQNPISATATGTGVEKSTAVRSYDCEASVHSVGATYTIQLQPRSPSRHKMTCVQ